MTLELILVDRTVLLLLLLQALTVLPVTRRSTDYSYILVVGRTSMFVLELLYLLLKG